MIIHIYRLYLFVYDTEPGVELTQLLLNTGIWPFSIQLSVSYGVRK